MKAVLPKITYVSMRRKQVSSKRRSLFI